jgi:hypothetical protein
MIESACRGVEKTLPCEPRSTFKSGKLDFAVAEPVKQVTMLMAALCPILLKLPCYRLGETVDRILCRRHPLNR